MPARNTDFPFADTNAARMLSAAIHRKKQEGTSLRGLARQLRYKQATVLSHMANGRIPIPLERVHDLAETLVLDEGEFAVAALTQRFPATDWRSLLPADRSQVAQAGEFLWKVEGAAGKPVTELSEEQIRIIMEVAATPEPARRWLSTPELRVLEMIRRERPNLTTYGLDMSDYHGIEALLDENK